MALIKAACVLLTIVVQVSFALGQAPDPALKQFCTQLKRDIFEERVPFSFLFANAPVQWETIDSCHGSRPLIVGGTPAEPKEFPHMARLGNRDSSNKTNWLCGGTLISKRLVLTAAHCLYSTRGAINVVRLGELDFASDKDDAQPEDFGVQKIIEHPGYNYTILYNDIALLQLDRAVSFSVYKHPACLPFHDGQDSENFIAIGWGHQRFAASKESTKLLKVQLKNFGTECLATTNLNELPNGYNVSTMLCIGSPENKDTCNGDSGGPVLNYHDEYPCMYHVMGVTSVGIGCDTGNVPSIYTRVHFYLDWIKQEMANSN
ncbi:venom protease-like [Drosophila novamexicana]|uniref:venom protease-like n=1 Tax=Drosophila novamexicana TaxID=47314 RepID=UPI0011E5FD89|nr:venom protease-like [Drosophila novamexicana]